MDYLDWSRRLLLSFSYSAGHSAFSQESVKQYFKINITAVIPRFKENAQTQWSVPYPQRPFLWCVCFYC